jgi:hypothetical protein
MHPSIKSVCLPALISALMTPACSSGGSSGGPTETPSGPSNSTSGSSSGSPSGLADATAQGNGSSSGLAGDDGSMAGGDATTARGGGSSGGGDGSVGAADGGGSLPGNGGSSGGAGGGPTTGAGDAGVGSGDASATEGGRPSGTGGTPVACPPSTQTVAGNPTTVTLNLAGPPMATIGSDFMGIHTAVYDGTLGAVSTATLLKAAGVTSLRYPGGSYADLYHWETHTGTATPAAGAGSNTIVVAPTANFGSFVSIVQNVGGNAFITVNYGMNSRATGPGSPKEAAAWVAYANGSPSDTTVIGPDNSVPPVDFMTVGYWAGLRAAQPLATDDGRNFLRINHPAPAGIKLWEIGNELYGNGYYPMYGAIGWEADYHVLYGSASRGNNPALSPATYGAGVAAFAAAMKAVDPTIKIGGVLSWPDINPSFDGPVLTAACAAMDFASVHWYPGDTLASLYTHPRNDIPAMFTALHAAMASTCPAGAKTNLPIAVTEWGPNTINGGVAIGQAWHPATGSGTQTQIGGIFAAESYANFMEQGALALHWAQLHDNQYLLATPTPDTPGFGYHGQLIAHYLGASGDTVLSPPTSSSPTLFSHATRRADGTIGVMLSNVGITPAAVTLNASGSRPLGCTGTVYTYVPIANNNDGPVGGGSAISSSTANSGSTVSSSRQRELVSFSSQNCCAPRYRGSQRFGMTTRQHLSVDVANTWKRHCDVSQMACSGGRYRFGSDVSAGAPRRLTAPWPSSHPS